MLSQRYGWGHAVSLTVPVYLGRAALFGSKRVEREAGEGGGERGGEGGKVRGSEAELGSSKRLLLLKQVLSEQLSETQVDIWRSAAV